MIAFDFPLERAAVPAALAGAFAVLLAMEWRFPLRRRTRPTGRRVLTNLLVSALAFAAGAGVVRPVAARLIGWASAADFGLLRALPLPMAARLGLGVLLMDLTFYYWHRLNHELAILWRFHSAHHVDPDMDVTTSFRFHAGEILYSAGFRAAQVTLLGVGATTYVVYEAVFQASTLFHHSNLRVPIRLERLVNRVLVTPRMHGVHHSVRRREVNSNYSVVFRFWDALHRTLILNVPQAQISIGVSGYQEEGDNRFWRLLLQPFRRQKAPAPGAGPAPRAREQAPGPRTFMAE